MICCWHVECLLYCRGVYCAICTSVFSADNKTHLRDLELISYTTLFRSRKASALQVTTPQLNVRTKPLIRAARCPSVRLDDWLCVPGTETEAEVWVASVLYRLIGDCKHLLQKTLATASTGFSTSPSYHPSKISSSNRYYPFNRTNQPTDPPPALEDTFRYHHGSLRNSSAVHEDAAKAQCECERK